MENVFQIAVLRVCLAALAVLLSASALVGLRRVGSLLLRRLKPFALAALLPMAALLTDFAGEKNTNMPMRVIQPVASQVFSSCGAVTNSDWLAHGAYDAWFRIPATNWWARTADGWLDGVTVFAWCEFRPDVRTTNAYPRPFPQKLSLAPLANWQLLAGNEDPQQLNPSTSQHSLFWHGVTGSNTLVMTWQDGLYARCATNLVSFQAELFNDGSVAYRYDGSPVATNDFVVPLGLPFDRDGDGLENSVDPEPDVAGPDAHGTNAEWYNTVCSNVFEAVATSCDPPVELSWLEDVNSNAYYFVDVVAERGPAPIWFSGDRTSRLGDPVVVARAGETNRVPLLVGVDYAVTSDTPFSVSFPVDYMYPEVVTNEPCVARIRWPLEFMVSGAPSSYTVETIPQDLDGAFEWDLAASSWGQMRGASSCLSSAIGGYVSFSCSADCTCGGCSISGRYSYERATFALPILRCGCSGSDDPEGEPTPTPHFGPDGNPSVSVSFDKTAVIFENRYENTPGSWVERNSSSATLTVTAYGGGYGASLSVSSTNLGRLEQVGGNVLPTQPVPVPAGYDVTYTVVCKGYEASQGENDIRVNASVTDGMTGASRTDSAAITSIRVELEPEKVAPGNNCPNRHVYGVREEVNCKQTPNAPVITWDIDSDLGIAVTVVGARISNTLPPRLVCPLNAQYTFTFKAKCGLAVYPFDIQVLNPSGIRCADCVWNERTKFDHKIGYAGWVGMYLTLYVEPLSVSFGNIDVSEVPSTGGNHTEYFDYLDMQYRTHTVATGAGVWHHVLDNNYFAIDHVQCLNRPQTWIDGSQMTWQVPHGWHERAEADMWPIGMTPLSDNVFATDITQMTTLNANGLVNMSKHGHAVSRSTNNCVRVDGAIVHEGE